MFHRSNQFFLNISSYFFVVAELFFSFLFSSVYRLFYEASKKACVVTKTNLMADVQSVTENTLGSFRIVVHCFQSVYVVVVVVVGVALPLLLFQLILFLSSAPFYFFPC